MTSTLEAAPAPDCAPSTYRRYAGAEWVAASLGITLSPLGVTVANLLAAVYRGMYNAPLNQRKVQWTRTDWIDVTIRQTLDTYDGSDLTTLVLAAHAMCVRVEVQPASPRHLRLCFSPRQRSGNLTQHHPTIDQAVARFRQDFGYLEQEGPQP